MEQEDDGVGARYSCLYQIWCVCILSFHPSYLDCIYVGVSDCLVLACAKVLGTLQPCQLLWPPKAFLLPKRLQT